MRRIPVRRIVVRPDEVLQPDRRPFASFPLTRLVTWSVGVSTAIVAAFLAIAALIAWLLAPDRIR